ncbi:MAG: hypothetical protein PWR17_961 [Candidatus Methanomethylophilaceae archaeon]|nr:hypothetical protein [Candidatus Methanomethylophilaceae archaeon]
MIEAVPASESMEMSDAEMRIESASDANIAETVIFLSLTVDFSIFLDLPLVIITLLAVTLDVIAPTCHLGLCLGFEIENHRPAFRSLHHINFIPVAVVAHGIICSDLGRSEHSSEETFGNCFVSKNPVSGVEHPDWITDTSEHHTSSPKYGPLVLKEETSAEKSVLSGNNGSIGGTEFRMTAAKAALNQLMFCPGTA